MHVSHNSLYDGDVSRIVKLPLCKRATAVRYGKFIFFCPVCYRQKVSRQPRTICEACLVKPRNYVLCKKLMPLADLRKPRRRHPPVVPVPGAVYDGDRVERIVLPVPTQANRVCPVCSTPFYTHNILRLVCARCDKYRPKQARLYHIALSTEEKIKELHSGKAVRTSFHPW